MFCPGETPHCVSTKELADSAALVKALFPLHILLKIPRLEHTFGAAFQLVLVEMLNGDDSPVVKMRFVGHWPAFNSPAWPRSVPAGVVVVAAGWLAIGTKYPRLAVVAGANGNPSHVSPLAREVDDAGPLPGVTEVSGDTDDEADSSEVGFWAPNRAISLAHTC